MKMMRILLLLGLTSCVCGSPAPHLQTYQVEENKNITVEMNFPPEANASISEHKIMCRCLPGEQVFFHLGNSLKDPLDEQFAGRVQCDTDALREGRVRLHLSGARTNDSGEYLCRISTGSGKEVSGFSLNVTAVRDQPEPEKPDPLSLPGRGRTGLYGGLGLMAAVVSLGWLITSCSSRRRRLSKSVVGGLSSSGSEEPV